MTALSLIRPERPAEDEPNYRELLQGLAAAVYTCDAQGRITFYNDAAAKLWGREPRLGHDLWCGSCRIFRPDGAPMPLDACPMALAIKGQRGGHRDEIIIERPDGVRRVVLPHPEPRFDASGALVGAINLLVDITDRKRSEAELAATRDDLARHVDALTRLHELAVFLAGTHDLDHSLGEILSALVALSGSGKGLVFLPDAPSSSRPVAASVGFSARELEIVTSAEHSGAPGTTGAAMKSKRRIVIEDTEEDPRCAPLRAAARAVGFRAVQSTPLVSRAGETLGVMSVYLRERCTPGRMQHQLADICAGHAAEVIEAAASREAIERYRTGLDDLVRAAPRNSASPTTDCGLPSAWPPSARSRRGSCTTWETS